MDPQISSVNVTLDVHRSLAGIEIFKIARYNKVSISANPASRLDNRRSLSRELHEFRWIRCSKTAGFMGDGGNGTISHGRPDVKPAEHSAQVLAALAEIQK